MTTKHLAEMYEMRKMAREVYSAANALQEAAATLLSTQKQNQQAHILQELMNYTTQGYDIMEIVDAIHNLGGLDHVVSAAELPATRNNGQNGRSRPETTRNNGRNGRTLHAADLGCHT